MLSVAAVAAVAVVIVVVAVAVAVENLALLVEGLLTNTPNQLLGRSGRTEERSTETLGMSNAVGGDMLQLLEGEVGGKKCGAELRWASTYAWRDQVKQRVSDLQRNCSRKNKSTLSILRTIQNHHCSHSCDHKVTFLFYCQQPWFCLACEN